MSPVFNHAEGKSTLSLISIGGKMEVFFFIGGTAKQVIQQYQKFIGKPALPPFWALGWHFSSERWENQTVIDEFLTQMQGFPVDALWLNSYLPTSWIQNATQKIIASVPAVVDADNSTDIPSHDRFKLGDALIKSSENPSAN